MEGVPSESLNDVLRKGDMRRASNFSGDFKCYNCNNQVETVVNILRDSPVARYVWRGSCLGLNIAANTIVPWQWWITDWCRYFLSLKNAAKEIVIEFCSYNVTYGFTGTQKSSGHQETSQRSHWRWFNLIWIWEGKERISWPEEGVRSIGRTWRWSC